MNCFALLVCFLLAAIPAVGQTPKTAGSGPVVSASLGYSYLNLGLQPSRASLNGLDAAFTADFHRRFGVTLDLGYVRGSDVNGGTRHADVLSYLAGPVAYITRNKGLTTYYSHLRRRRKDHRSGSGPTWFHPRLRKPTGSRGWRRA
jgi:hypothetical protein